MRGSLTPEAFAARYEAALPGLWCVAVAIVGDRTLAEDVVQEAAIVGLRKIDRFDPSSSFIAWMGQIVRYLALNTSRRRGRLAPSAAELDALPGGAASAPTPVTPRGALAAEQASFDDRVVRALGRLDETARACLLLRTVVEMPYEEIAATLAIPEGTAMSHVHRSRKAMRLMLEEENASLAKGEGS